MSDLSPGQEVTVSGMSGGTAYVVYVKGETVRVRMADGRRRTTRLENVTPKRESKALSVLVVGERPATFTRDAIIAAETDHILLHDQSTRPLRAVPKPVTLTSPAYLAYVRKHPCCLCGAPGPSEPHHWSHHGGVMGSKVDDYRTVPLCTEHHRHWHDHGTFPEMDREHSEAALMREQAWLLRAWLDNNVAHYGDQVDALIRAIGGADA